MLCGGEKFQIPAAAGSGKTSIAERRLRIKMNKAEIRELIPFAPVYRGVERLSVHIDERH
jgi:hypothetical protein